MRSLTLALFAFAAAATAQSPLTTTFANNSGNAVGGNVYFDLDVTDPVGITITSLEINTGTQFAAPVLEVSTVAGSYVNSWNNAAGWNLLASAPVEPAGPGNPSRVCFGAGFYLPLGQHGVTLHGNGIDHGYTIVTGLFPVVYSTNELTLIAGGATNTLFGGLLETPRVWNGSILYHSGPPTGSVCASSSTFGTGCDDLVASWYEEFTNVATFDFAGSPGSEVALRAAFDGVARYVVDSAPGAWFTPAGNKLVTNVIGTTLGDNQVSQPLSLPFAFPFTGGSVPTIHATSDGAILLGAGFSINVSSSPSILTLLALQAQICPLWCDLHASWNASTNPASGVYYDIDPSGQTVYVTWLDVAARQGPQLPGPGATSVNVQCALHASGDIEFRYGTITPQQAQGPAIIGWSPGRISGSASADPGNIDLSASLPLVVQGPDSSPLRHSVGIARLGTDLQLTVANAEPLASFALLIVGDTQFAPGVALTAVGAPGCFAHINGLASAFVALGLGGSGTYSLPIPNNQLLTGSTFYSQFATPTLRNALGLLTSNGARWLLGN